MALITNLVATTELEVINAMLASTGQAPLTDLSSVTAADVTIAVNTLRDAAREVQSQGWRFNTEWGVKITPTSYNFSWSEGGATVAINVFKALTNLAAFFVSPIADQIDKSTGELIDIVARPSKQYTESGQPVLVYYDRVNNRDGFKPTDRSAIWLDTISYFNFEQLPEVCRKYISVLATRRFIAKVMPSGSLVSFTQEDEKIALRALVREQGETDTYNMLDHPDVARILGGRPRGAGTFIQLRSTP